MTSTSVIVSARQALWDPDEIGEPEVTGLLGRLSAKDIDTGELFFQLLRHEAWGLEDGKVKSGAYSVDRGVGVRAISGEKTGFAYADSIALPALREATEAARSIARTGYGSGAGALTGTAATVRYADVDPITSAPEDAKVALLHRIDGFARGLDPRVSEVVVRVALDCEINLVVSTDGLMSGDARPMARFDVMVLAEQDGRRERGVSGGGGRFDTAWLFDTDAAEEYAREAVRIALVNLDAVDAPAGAMPVVLGPGWPGVLLHEAVGHGLEGDFNRKGTSAFSGRMGEVVASELCTVIDDATLADRRGSLSVDDEGTPGQRTTLIENGVLVGYMQDKHNARLMGAESTGNGRRQSYAHLPMPRMTNTFLAPGESEPDEIIASVDKGVYAVSFGGGQVDITSGKFVFSATEAYLIEGGQVGPAIRGATLIGNGPEVMQRVSMVGDDFKLDGGVGICGKDGQTIPVGVGQPTLKIDEITVGGTGAALA
ncbi:MAG: metalloprotease TldD [Gammaproteobacteria bacterium]|nr:metalloprotease TldD [Gammaproteobacteria bacterium]MYF30863.1 metalloprotease TldD [Gammaproteobacteria bacterium]MYK46486.1 metalloprotease TldD [Gammaproteobacteria bacterium]